MGGPNQKLALMRFMSQKTATIHVQVTVKKKKTVNFPPETEACAGEQDVKEEDLKGESEPVTT